jgi:hypothetical protein
VKTIVGATLLAWASLAWGQRPADQDTAALLARTRQKAREYTQSLPDFLATELIHRYAGSLEDGFGGHPVDTLTVHLRYFQHKEEHKLVLIDGKPADRSFETLEGTLGSGEFETTLGAIFDPASETAFHWKSWKTVHGRRIAVVDYEVGPHSRYHLRSLVDGRTMGANVGYHGLLEIDAETGEVLHFEYGADHIPEALHLRSADTTVDYTFFDIGGTKYLLPSRCRADMSSLDGWARNVIDFREYRKFAADSSIEFGPAK